MVKKNSKKISSTKSEHHSRNEGKKINKKFTRFLGKEFYIFVGLLVIFLILLFIFVLIPQNSNNSFQSSNLNAVCEDGDDSCSEIINNENGILASIDGKNISSSDLDKEIDIQLYLQGLPATYKNQISTDKILNQTISLDLLYSKALESGYSDDLNGTYEKYALYLNQTGRDVESFKTELENQSFTYDDLINYYDRQIVIGNFVNAELYDKIVVENSTLLDYYNSNKEQFLSEDKISASHILVNSSELAQELIGQLDNGANFSELAKEYSIGPSAPRGGDLGYFSKAQMVENFSNAAFNLSNIGDYTHTPVQTSFGYHIILLTGKEPSRQLAFDEIRDDLYSQYLSQEKETVLQNYISGLFKSSNVTIYN